MLSSWLCWSAASTSATKWASLKKSRHGIRPEFRVSLSPAKVSGTARFGGRAIPMGGFGMRTHPVAIVTTSARNVAVSARPIRPALAPDSVSQISFILACSCLKPFVHPVLIGRWTTASPSARGSAIRTSRNSRRHPAGDAQWGISSLPSVRQCQLEVA